MSVKIDQKRKKNKEERGEKNYLYILYIDYIFEYKINIKLSIITLQSDLLLLLRFYN